MTSDKTLKDRLIPYRVLAFLLYAEGHEWLQPLADRKVRIFTGPAARHFRQKSLIFWDTLFWLEKAKLIEKVEKERKRGTVIITLREVDR